MGEDALDRYFWRDRPLEAVDRHLLLEVVQSRGALGGILYALLPSPRGEAAPGEKCSQPPLDRLWMGVAPLLVKESPPSQRYRYRRKQVGHAGGGPRLVVAVCFGEKGARN